MISSLNRICLVASNTAGEAVRQRYFLLSGILAAIVAALSTGLRVMDITDRTSELKFTADIGFGTLFFFGSLLAVVLPAHLFFTEMENRTALTLLARPLRRWEFLCGKLMGVWLLLTGLVATVSLVTGIMIAVRHSELAGEAIATGHPAPVFNVAGALLFALLQSVRLGLVAALTLFGCAYARSALFAYGAGLGWLAAGQTAWVAREWLQGTEPSFTKNVVGVLLRGVPDLQAFNLSDALIFPTKVAPYADAWSAVLYGVIWMGVLTALGARLFRNREF